MKKVPSMLDTYNVSGASVQNLVAQATWRPGYVHPCDRTCWHCCQKQSLRVANSKFGEPHPTKLISPRFQFVIGNNDLLLL